MRLVGEGKAAALDERRPIFAIFEGGGAKGVAHVGAFAACEAANFYFVGVAGASAGAVVACLIAAGFGADELLDRAAPDQNLLSRYGESITSLLGQAEWDHLVRRRDQLLAVAQRGMFSGLRAALQIPPILGDLYATWRRKGFFSTDKVREVLNTVLREQLIRIHAEAGIIDPPPARIAFKDLDYATYPRLRPLKIIGANVTTRELVIFSQEDTPDVEVALAVASSIAIPVVFQPVRVPDAEGHRHMDGGAVSNLPVWAFVREKLAFERAHPEAGQVPIVGFTLKDAPPEPGRTPTKGDGMFRYLIDGLWTALTGSQGVIHSFLDDLTVIPLTTRLSTLDFGALPSDLLGAYDDGLRCATGQLEHHFVERPALIGEELERVHKRVRQALIRRRPTGGRRKRILLRANVVERFDRDVFRVTHAFNMADDTDDRLPLDARGRGAPRAFADRDARFTLVGDAAPQISEDYMTKYERALANHRIRGIISVPIFKDPETWLIEDPEQRPPPCGVLSIDSDREEELESAFLNDDFMSLFTTQSTLLYPALTKEPPSG